VKFVIENENRWLIIFDFTNEEDCIIFDHINHHGNFEKGVITISFIYGTSKELDEIAFLSKQMILNRDMKSALLNIKSNCYLIKILSIIIVYSKGKYEICNI